MAVTEEVLIKINTAQSAKNIAELEAGLKLGRKALKEAELGSKEYNSVLKATTELQKKLTNVTRIGTKEISDADNSYNALSRTLSILKEDWKKLGDGVERTNLGKKIQDVNNRLKELDATTGVYSRNVGNYGAMFGNLQFQIQQVAREIPSLSVGFNTFFLAISNNLPMLSDEFARAREQIRLMQAEGQKVPSLASVIAKSVFSWQTALVAVLTVLTLYGKDIVRWGKNLLSAAGSADVATKATRNLNKSMQEGNDTLADQLTTIRLLQMEWGLLGGNLDKQKRFIDENQTAFANLGISVKDVSDFEKAFIDNTSSLIQSLNQRARATAAQELAQEAYKKALIERAKVEEKIAQGTFDTVVEGYGVGSELMKPQHRDYTAGEQQEMLAPVVALEAQADAYLEIAANAKAAADSILNFASIQQSGTKNGGVGVSDWQGDLFVGKTPEDTTAAYQEQRIRYLTELAEIKEQIRNFERNEEEAFAKDVINLEKQITKNKEEEAKKQKAIIDREKKWQRDKYNYIAQIAGAAAQVAGRETAAGKAFAVASATISTYLSAQQAFQSQFQPVADITSPARGALAAAAAVASGIANIRSILSVKTDGITGKVSMPGLPGASVQTYAPAIVQQVPVVRSLTGASEEERLNQLTESNKQIAASPVRAYVVYSDIEGAQKYTEQTESEASF